MGVSLLVVRLLLSPLVLYFSTAYAKGDSGAAPESLTIATSHYGDDTALPRNVDIDVPYYPSLGYFSLTSRIVIPFWTIFWNGAAVANCRSQM